MNWSKWILVMVILNIKMFTLFDINFEWEKYKICNITVGILIFLMKILHLNCHILNTLESTFCDNTITCASKWFILAQKTTKSRDGQSQVCYLFTTHLRILNFLEILDSPGICEFSNNLVYQYFPKMWFTFFRTFCVMM